jgi:hypothetical protein
LDKAKREQARQKSELSRLTDKSVNKMPFFIDSGDDDGLKD